MLTPPIQPAGQPHEGDEAREREHDQRRAAAAKRPPATPFGLPPRDAPVNRPVRGDRPAPKRAPGPQPGPLTDSVARIPPVPKRPRPSAELSAADHAAVPGAGAPTKEGPRTDRPTEPGSGPHETVATDAPSEPRARRRREEQEQSTPVEAARAGEEPPLAAETTFVPVAPSTEPAPAVLPPPGVMDRVVEFARLSRTADGLVEFTMGLKRGILGGVRVQVVAYGQRKVGLRVSRLDREAGVGEDDVAGLVGALRERGVEVVEVVTAEARPSPGAAVH